MNQYDVEITKELRIIDINSAYTVIQVEPWYLNKIIEVKVPHNIQEGHRIRIKGMGLIKQDDSRGDLFVVITKIICEKSANSAKMEWENNIKQKMIAIKNHNFCEVNDYLAKGWKVKDFKPFKDGVDVYIYVLLEL